jgi:sporulation protein YlmC with PRC-barrel domain
MDSEKRYSKQIIGKRVASKTGKEFGTVSNIIFEIRTGEVIQLALKNTTGYSEGLDLERTKEGELLIPYSCVTAYGDFIVIAEEDLM